MRYLPILFLIGCSLPPAGPNEIRPTNFPECSMKTLSNKKDFVKLYADNGDILYVGLHRSYDCLKRKKL